MHIEKDVEFGPRCSKWGWRLIDTLFLLANKVCYKDECCSGVSHVTSRMHVEEDFRDVVVSLCKLRYSYVHVQVQPKTNLSLDIQSDA